MAVQVIGRARASRLLTWLAAHDGGYYLRGLSMLLLAQGLAMACAAGSAYAWTNYASRELYGQYAFVSAVQAALVAVTLPGAAPAVTYAVARGNEGVLLPVVWLRTRWSLLGMLGLAGAAVYCQWQGKNALAQGFLAAALTFPLFFSLDTVHSFLQGRKRFTLYGVARMATTAVVTIVTVGAVLLTRNLFLIVMLPAVATILLNLVLIAIVERRANRAQEASFPQVARRFSLVAVVGAVSSQADQLFLGCIRGMEPLALYHFGDRLAEPMRVLGISLNKLAFPKMVKGTLPDLLRAFRRRLLLWIALVVGLGVAGWLLVPVIVTWWFPRYRDGIRFAQVLTLANSWGVAGMVLVALFQSQAALHQWYLRLGVGFQLLRIVLLACLVFPFGIQGVVITQLAIASLSLLTYGAILWVYACRAGTRPAREGAQ